MKKNFYIIVLSFISLLFVIGCVEKDEISQWNSLYDLREQNIELKDMCYKINNNINSIQKLVEAQKDNLGIKSVTNVSNGYIIVFSDDSFVTLLNGKDGVDGKDGVKGTDGKDGKDGKDGVDGKDGEDAIAYIPSISVKMYEGVYYWTLDGEFLTDDEGNKICAQGKDGADGKDGINGTDGKDGKDGINGTDGKDGKDGVDGKDGINGADGKDGKDGVNGKDAVVPQLKVEDNSWLISYDDGKTWKSIGSASGANGKDGVDGKDGKDGVDGITPQIKIENGKYLVSYDNGGSWTSIGVSLSGGSDTNAPVSGYVDGYAYVDLGLTSGTLWARINIGADKYTDIGTYFQWGCVVSPIDNKYSEANCNENNKSYEKLLDEGYIESVEEPVLTPECDAATFNWGSNWRMPTKEDFEELQKECIWTETKIGGISGHKVASEKFGNANWIFIPKSGAQIGNKTPQWVGEYSHYWSSSASRNIETVEDYYNQAYEMTDASISTKPRFWGFAIRPVVKEK